MTPPYHIVNNRAAHRFEIEVEGELAVLEYSETDRAVDLRHTEVPPALAGQGIGGALAAAGLAYARDAGKRVIPTCPFVAAYLRKHPDANAAGDPSA